MKEQDAACFQNLYFYENEFGGIVFVKQMKIISLIFCD